MNGSLPYVHCLYPLCTTRSRVRVACRVIMAALVSATAVVYYAVQTFASLREQMEAGVKARTMLTRDRDEARRRAEANDQTIVMLVEDRLQLKQQVGWRVWSWCLELWRQP